jgi:hypothetical protein
LLPLFAVLPVRSICKLLVRPPVEVATTAPNPPRKTTHSPCTSRTSDRPVRTLNDGNNSLRLTWLRCRRKKTRFNISTWTWTTTARPAQPTAKIVRPDHSSARSTVCRRPLENRKPCTKRSISSKPKLSTNCVNCEDSSTRCESSSSASSLSLLPSSLSSSSQLIPIKSPNDICFLSHIASINQS